jgi:hypothetical protein
MFTEAIYETEDTYVFEPGRMVTVRVIVNDYTEEQPIALPGQQQQFPDEITLQEGDMLCMVAKGKSPGKAQAKAAPNRKVRVLVTPR